MAQGQKGEWHKVDMARHMGEKLEARGGGGGLAGEAQGWAGETQVSMGWHRGGRGMVQGWAVEAQG